MPSIQPLRSSTGGVQLSCTGLQSEQKAGWNMTNDKDQSLALIDAIGRGDASASDIAAQLRARGIDSLESVISELKQAVKTREELTRLSLRPVELRRRGETPP